MMTLSIRQPFTRHFTVHTGSGTVVGNTTQGDTNTFVGRRSLLVVQIAGSNAGNYIQKRLLAIYCTEGTL